LLKGRLSNESLDRRRLAADPSSLRGEAAIDYLKQQKTYHSLVAAVRNATTPNSVSWQEESQLIASDGAQGDLLGWSVAVSGNTALVAAVDRDNSHGAVYVFVRDNRGAWTQQQMLTAYDGSDEDHFGSSVAISGDQAIVGADADTVNGQGLAGSAYPFFRINGTWFPETKLTASDGGIGRQFGYSVSISGDTVVIGVSGQNYLGPPREGAAYVFVRNGQDWTQQAKLTAGDDAIPQDGFGLSVAIDGDKAIIGAPSLKVGENENQGAAYVFERDSETWSEPTKLTSFDGTALDAFGLSVGISGDRVIVGQRSVDSQTTDVREAAYIFERNNDTWTETTKLIAFDSASRISFGTAVAIDGDTCIVGAFGAQIGLNEKEGAAYVFSRRTGAWLQEEKLTASDGEANDNFGGSVAIDGEAAIVGSVFHKVGENFTQGAAYAFLGSPDTDGDGLPDDWERNGVTLDGEFIDLPAMGADPMHQDIFVHVDWMQPDPSDPDSNFHPNPASIIRVVTAFAIAPRNNPDNKPGINLHVDFGPDSPLDPVTGTTWGALSRAGSVPFQTLFDTANPPTSASFANAFVPTKTIHFTPAKRSRVFHYAIYCNDIDRAGPGGLGFVKGVDFAVASDNQINPIVQANTFMHELGHNLGLLHGGGDKFNHKPNYISIMNYSFPFGVISPDGTMFTDYSSFSLPTLDEFNLDENVGISDPSEQLTLWSKLTRPDSPPGSNKCLANRSGYYKLFLPSPALDWNCNGVKDSAPVVADIDGDGICVFPGPNGVLFSLPEGDDQMIDQYIVAGPNRVCESRALDDDKQQQQVGYVQQEFLNSFNDWPALRLDGGGKIGPLGRSHTPANQHLQGEDGELPDEEPLADILALQPPDLVDAVMQGPLDVVSPSPAFGSTPLVVNFDGTASSAVNGTIVSWTWDFGDRTTGSGALISHVYSTTGTYFAKLTVTDSNGRTNLMPLWNRVTVTDASPTPTPTPTPTATPTPSVTPTPVPTPTPGAGDVDPAFGPTVTQNFGDITNVVATQPDGKILIGGYFESFGGALQRGIARINPDGSADLTFKPGLAVPLPQVPVRVKSLALQPDGKILLGLSYSSFDPLNVHPLVERLNPDGSLDSAFNTTALTTQPFSADNVMAIVLQPDGKIIVGGNFRYLNSNNAQRFGFARLNSDGSLDSSFDFNQGLGTQGFGALALALQPDGKILFGFGTSSSFPRRGIARLNANGSLDLSFNAIFLGVATANRLLLQPDGKVIAAGGFDFTGFNTTNEILARFNSDGTRDNTFTDIFPSSVALNPNTIYDFALQPDGKIVIGGGFHLISPAVRNHIVRLNQDGTLDTSLDSGANAQLSESVYTVALQTNAAQSGKIVITGNFRAANGQSQSFAGQSAEDILQLNNDGSRDPLFTSNGPGFTLTVNSLIQQPDGKLLVGFPVVEKSTGLDIAKLNAIQRQAIGRLNPDGTTDTSFTSPFQRGGSSSNVVTAMALQPDGKIVVSGFFKTGAPNNYINLTRLNADGSIDAGFVPYAFAGLGPVVVRADGKIIATNNSALVRLNASGSLDSIFGSVNGSDGFTATQVSALVLQPDGKLLVAGSFTQACHTSCVARNDIARFNSDGSVDMTFDPGVGAQGSRDVLNTLTLQVDGKIVVGGSFLTFNGTARPCLARLNQDGTLDTSFNPNTILLNNRPVVGALAVQLDGKIIVGSAYEDLGLRGPHRIFRLLADGSLDPSFKLGSGIENGEGRGLIVFTAITLQADGGIVFAGNFNVVNGVPRLSLARLLPGGQTPTVADGSVSGQISDTNGNPVEGVAIRMSGTQNRLTITNANGDYHFDDVETNGIYELTPSRANYTFSPSQRAFSQLGQHTDAAFTALPTGGGLNSSDTTEYFVRQQYLDFLNREPDESGFNFWVNNIDSCGANTACRKVKRIDTSAAFFLSIEFQGTGYLVERIYKASYGDTTGASTFPGTHQLSVPIAQLNEFLPDTQEIGRGVVVGQTGWETVLENNKQAFTSEFVQRSRFMTAFPNSMTPAHFVDRLFLNAGVTPAGSDRMAAINEFGSATTTTDVAARSRALLRVAEDSALNQQEFNRAFVLMQYFGYLRRNPNDPQDTDYTGYDFWLTKLNQFNGNYTNAEMVKAFILSSEYRQRSGP